MYPYILINKNIKVFVFHNRKKKSKHQSRIIGISKHNLQFINNEIIKIKKNLIWKIKKIDVFYEKIKNDKIFNFEKSGDSLFSTVKNNDLYKILNDDLKKNNLFNKILIKNKNFYKKILEEKKYQLIINCESNNEIIKRYFEAFSNKDVETLRQLFAENVKLRDWAIMAAGRNKVIDANRTIFNSFDKITVEIVSVCTNENTASCEILIDLDDEHLLVNDVIEFDDEMKIKEVRAYKGN